MQWFSIVAFSLVAAASASTSLYAHGVSKSPIWDGIDTSVQAERGQPVYAEHCARCRSKALEGKDEIPPLKGHPFMSDWDVQSVSDLVRRIRSTMPLDDPGSLSAAWPTDLVAYLLPQIDAPVGKPELPGNPFAQAAVQITAVRPDKTSAPASAPATAQQALAPVNEPPNPYKRTDSFFKLPKDRKFGATSTVAGDSKGNIWVVDRCGKNDCAGSPLDPVMQFDSKGHFIKSWGAGKILFPHGIFIDKDDHIWIADNHNDGKIGDVVLKFDQNGKILQTLGKPGIAGNDEHTFHEPNAVIVAENGDIFVSDGHGGDTIVTKAHSPTMGNSRVMKFDKTGKFLTQWGMHGSGPREFQTPHCLAIDSVGRVFVGDRSNNRIQIFDQHGRFIAEWRQFGRPSGCYIDRNDVLYVSDSESRDQPGYGHHPGWKRGVRLGSAKTGKVTAFIPDDMDETKVNASGGEGVWADSKGVVYIAEVYQETIARYVPNPARKRARVAPAGH